MDVPIRTIARRTAVATAVVGSLAAGAATIQAASDWAASSAPAPAPQVSGDSIAQQLDVERSRSADLQSRLDAVNTQTASLAAALREATGKLSTDAGATNKLQKELAAAQKKLAALKAQMAATRVAPARASAPTSTHRVAVVTRHVTKNVTKTTTPTHATTSASGQAGGDDDHGGDDGGHGDD